MLEILTYYLFRHANRLKVNFLLNNDLFYFMFILYIHIRAGVKFIVSITLLLLSIGLQIHVLVLFAY